MGRIGLFLGASIFLISSITEAAPNTVIDTIAVGPELGQLAVNSQSTRLYVSNPSENSVSVIDITNDVNVLISTFTVGNRPNTIAINDGAERLYVVNEMDSTISVVDTHNDVFTVIDSIPDVGFFSGNSQRLIAFDASQELLFAKFGSGGGDVNTALIVVIDTHADANVVINTITSSGCGAGDMFFAGDLHRLYVICEDGEQLLIIDTIGQILLDTFQYGPLCPIVLGVSQSRFRTYGSGIFCTSSKPIGQMVSLFKRHFSSSGLSYSGHGNASFVA